MVKKNRIVDDQRSVYCLEIGFNSNNVYLRWWYCLEKERVENERCGFANKKSQIEKRNNQVVVEIKTLHVSSVDNTSWKLLERESWWTVSQNLQTHFDELL